MQNAGRGGVRVGLHRAFAIGVTLVVASLGSLPASAAPRDAQVVTFRPSLVTAIGDSVMLDIRPALGRLIPHLQVWGSVGQQFVQLPAFLRSLEAHGDLGATVIVELGTNGYITAEEIRQTMAILGGARRVVFANVHAPRGWTNPNNALLAGATRRYRNVVIANWNRLARSHPSWFYADGIHMPIGGVGAYAYARLLVTAIR